MLTGPSSPSTPRPASRIEWCAAGLLAANLGWTTLCLGGYRPETMLITCGLTGLTLAFLLAERSWLRHSRRWHPAGWWLVPFLAYAAWNVLFVSPVRWLGWSDWFGWANLVAVFWIALNALSAPGPRRLVHGMLAGLATVAAGLAAYQHFVNPEWLMLGRTQSYQFIGRASGPFGIPNSLGAFLLLLLPPALVVTAGAGGVHRGLRAACGGLVVLMTAGLFLTFSRGAWLAGAIALAAWPLLTPGRNGVRRVGLAAAVLGVFAGALMLSYLTVPTVRARLDALVNDAGERTRPIMWRGAWRLFLDAPVTGTGAGSYNVLFERHRPAGFRDEPQWAHNDYLNTLSDYGLVGVGLLVGGAALTARRRRAPRGDGSVEGARGGRAPASWSLPGVAVRPLRSNEPVMTGADDAVGRALQVGLLAFGLSLLVDFHLKIPALAMALSVCAAEWVRRRGPVIARADGPRFAHVVNGAAAVGVLALTTLLAWPHHRAEALRYGPRRLVDGWAEGRVATLDEGEVLARARPAFGRAVAVDPGNAQAWSDLAYVTALQARHEPDRTRALGREAEQAARRALALSAVVPEFWWRLGVALDLQGRWSEGGAAFARALELAPHNALGWYYQAYHFSINSSTRALARPALATCLRLDPGYRPAEALWEELKVAP